MPVKAALFWEVQQGGTGDRYMPEVHWPTSPVSSMSFHLGEGPCLKTVWTLEMIKEVLFYLLYKTWASTLMVTVTHNNRHTPHIQVLSSIPNS